MRLLLCAFLFLSLSRLALADLIVDFEELTFFTGNSLAGGGQFYNGDSGIGTNTNGWSSQGVFFGNSYNSGFGGFWNGFSYSNVVNTTTAGFTNQYAAFSPGSPGSGANGSAKYAVAYAGSQAFFNLPTEMHLSSVAVNNTTYAVLSMQNGDQFAKKFGGPTGNDPDFFRVTFNGFDSLNGSGNLVGAVTVTLADYTFADNSLDYILTSWLTVDLSPIANARSVRLDWESSDMSPPWINTPTYLALDNLTLTSAPEPSSFVLLGLVGTGAAWWRRRKYCARFIP